ncbi:MAG: hypothetical protein LBH42_06665, partial [Treponema sp.]|nr:hypothetical protein [Treponema sp.]
MKKAFFAFLATALILILTGCPNPQVEETGTITLTFGEGARTAWPPTDANGLLSLLEHRVKLILKNSSTVTEAVISKGKNSASISVTPGIYTVLVEAFLEGILFASGDGFNPDGNVDIEVKAGQNAKVTVEMDEAVPNAKYFIVSNINEWDTAKNAAASGGSTFILLTNNITIAPPNPPTFGSTSGVNVTIAGKHTISLNASSTGSLLDIEAGQTVTIQDVTLKGHSTNNASLVFVSTGGTFIMNGQSSVTGNRGGPDGGGVAVSGNNSRFEMNGGTISGNTATQSGGGVSVSMLAKFYMTGGTIGGTGNDRNTVSGSGGNGGGVYVGSISTFEMSGDAKIIGNTVSASSGNGGGV